MRGVWARLRSLGSALGRRSTFESGLDEELRFHLEMRTADLVRRGLGAEEAARRARLELGGIEGWKEEAREARGLRIFDEIAQDLRVAWRTLVRWPGFSAVVLSTLALGIGAATAIFGLVDAVLLRPLPYEDENALVAVWTRYTAESGEEHDFIPLSVPEYRDYAGATRALTGIAAFTTARLNLAGGEDPPDRVRVILATADLFAVLRAEPLLGRTFRAGEDAAGAPCVVVLGHALWRERLGSSERALGRMLRLDGEPCEVVGVMPPGFFFPDEEVRLWRPVALDRDRALAEGRESHWLRAVGRLAGGAGPGALDAELRRLAGAWRGAHPHHTGHFLVSRPFREEVVGDQRAALGLLFAAVSLMLLIICANVGNLLLARAEGRQREMAVRAALGAGRGRLARQLLTESLLMTISGGVLGLLVAAGLMSLLGAGAAGTFPRTGGLALDARAIAFAAALVVIAGALFGLLPQLQGADRRARLTLQTGGRGTTAHRRAARVRRLLVVAEIALSLAVVSAAALMARSHERLRRVDLGIERSGVLALDLALPEASYRDRARIDGFYAPLRAAVLALPGVASAGLVSDLPLRSLPGQDGFRVEGRPEPGPGEPSFDGGYVMATPGYFATLGIPVLRGRGIAEGDVAGSPFVAVVDELAARRYWPDADPVGRRIRYYDDDAPWLTIVGVVGTVRYGSPRDEPRPTVYVPHAQAPRPSVFYTGRAMTLVVRAQSPPAAAALVAPIRAAAGRLDPSVPLTNVATLDEVVDRTTATLRTTTGLIAAFAVVSLLLGALGVYGILSFVVRTRTREIGIRMALGEGVGAVRRGVLRQGLALALAGVAIGGAAALLFGRLLTGLLFGISPHDPLTFGAAIVVLVCVSLIASYLPARRATLVPPAIALRGG